MVFNNSQNVDARGATFNSVQGHQYNYHSTDNSERVFEVVGRASVVDAQYNSSNHPPPCDHDTRTDILGKIYQWMNEPAGTSTQVCLLYGIAGSGKSAIAQSVSEHLENGRLGATFFFNRQEKNRCDTKRVVATILSQLVTFVPDLKPAVCEALKKEQNIMDTKSEHQLQKLVIEPLRSLPVSDSCLFIVIDALDECEDSVLMIRLLTLLADPNPKLPFPLRIFVTSRPEPHIRAIFREPTVNFTILSYDLQQFIPDADIRLFLERRLREFRRTRTLVMSEMPPSWPSSDELTALVKKSSGLFIYASTVAKLIGDEHAIPHERLKVILEIENWDHTDLDRLYKQILSAFPSFDGPRLVIGTIILLRSPLSCRALAHFLNMDIAHLQLVFEKLHSIFSIPENLDTEPVTIFHRSLHDFLTSRDRAGDYFIDPSLQHAEIVKCCLKHIATLPKFTFSLLNTPTQCQYEVGEHLKKIEMDRKAMTVLRYACRSWAFHLSETSQMKDVMDDMTAFCLHYLFSWCTLMRFQAMMHTETMSLEEQILVIASERARIERWRREQSHFRWQIHVMRFLMCIVAASMANLLLLLTLEFLDRRWEDMSTETLVWPFLATLVMGNLAMELRSELLQIIVLGVGSLVALVLGLVVLLVPVLGLHPGLGWGIGLGVGVVLACVIVLVVLMVIDGMIVKGRGQDDGSYHYIKECVLQARPSIDQMPMAWQYIFYRTLEIAQRLWRRAVYCGDEELISAHNDKYLCSLGMGWRNALDQSYKSSKTVHESKRILIPSPCK